MAPRLPIVLATLALVLMFPPPASLAEEFRMGDRPPTPEEQAYIDQAYTEVRRVEPNDVSRRRAQAEFEAAVRAGAPLPSVLARPSAADNSTLPYFPPIRAQAGQASCVCWASCYYYSTYTQARDEGIDVSGGDNDHICSPAFMYNLTNKGVDEGAVMAYTLARLNDIGCSSWTQMPYDSSDYTTWPPEAAWVEALGRRSLGACSIRRTTAEGLEALRQHLANGHLATMRFDIYEDWTYPGPVPGIDNAVYYCPTSPEFKGGHGVTIVGYDDNRSYVDHRDGETHYGAFLIANSWGPSWGVPNSTGAGTNGFFWIAYAAFLEGTLGRGEVYFNTDRDDYRPSMYAVAGVNHDQRGYVNLRGGAGNPTWPDGVTEPAIDYHGGTTLGVDDSRRIAVDLSDFTELIESNGIANLFVELTVAPEAVSNGTISSADFFLDLDGDSTYDTVSSGDPVVAAEVGGSEFACAVSSGAAAWYVDDDAEGVWDGSRERPCPTIQAALEASASGDLILVAPGAYPESLVVAHDCCLDGSGATRTVLQPSVAGPAIQIGSGAEVVVRDVTIRGTAAEGIDGVIVSGGSGRVVQSKIHSCDRGLAVEGEGDHLAVSETTVLWCDAGLEANAGTTEVSRCTFAGNVDGLRLGAAATIENTIVCESEASGIVREDGAPTPAILFCDVWGNGEDYTNCQPGAGCISADPMFFDPGNGYYCLGYGSPCVNAGTGDGASADEVTDIGAHAAVTAGTPEADYEYLQPAVNAASHRGRVSSVLVAPGTHDGWRGSVTLHSPVALIGESPSSVFLDGAGYGSSGVYVLDGAAGGAVSGFTIANQAFRGIKLELHSPDGTPVPFLIRNNIIRNNESNAIEVLYDSSPKILCNTLIDNTYDGVWVGQTCTALSVPDIQNNIIVGNGGNGIGDSVQNATSPWANYNNVYGNTTDYYGFSPGSDRLAVDPGFVDPGGHDYHLERCSPCVDAGNPTSDYSWEPEPNGGRVNMGAYGNTAEAQRSPSFPDVTCGYWAFFEIMACVDAGIVAGYDDGTYQPDWSVTRDQMAVYIARALAGGDDNVPEFTGTPTFPDVPDGFWALDHVEYAVAQNVVAGYNDGLYHPDYEVTRDQMAVYVARAMVAPTGEAALADYVPASPRNFPDVPTTGYGEDGTDPYWAYTHIEYCVENGVVQGYDDGYYRPQDPVTRDQMAVYIARAFKLTL